jgi:NitT/TauT family transport system substrate-binding protein
MIILGVFILIGCGTTDQTIAESPPEAAPAKQGAADLQSVRLGVGFVPNVQFAPFYLAQEKGFFADEGLEVEIEYGFENDFVALAAQGEREFAIASGDQVILAQAQGLPITYIMKWYERYPVALVVNSQSGVDTLAELNGHKVGLPGLFGATFVGWKALVHAANLDESRIDVEEIGFTQAAALQQGTVDAAMGYITNEPVQLRNEGLAVQVFQVSDYIDLVSNGLVVGNQLLNSDPDLVQKMVRASLRGLEATLDDPDEAFAVVREVIPELTDEDAPVQRQVLEASLELWRSDQPGLSSQQAWQDSVDFMRTTGLLAGEVQVDQLYTNRFVKAE